MDVIKHEIVDDRVIMGKLGNIGKAYNNCQYLI